MAAQVLAGWLVRLGFEVDKKSLLSMGKNLEAVEAKVKKTTIAATALSTAYVLAAKEFNSLFIQAQRAGTNIAGLKALETTFKNVGASAEEAKSAVMAIANGLKYTPGFAAMLGEGFGVATTKNGKLRNTVDILNDLQKAIAKMPPAVAKVRADAIGLGGIVDFLRDTSFAKEFERNAKLFNEFNASLNKDTEAVHEFSTEVDRTTTILKTGFLSTIGAIARSTGLQKWLEDVNDWLVKILPKFIELRGVIASVSDNPIDYLKNEIFHGKEIEADEAVKNGTATPEQIELAGRFNAQKIRTIERDKEYREALAQGMPLDYYYGANTPTMADLPKAYLDSFRSRERSRSSLNLESEMQAKRDRAANQTTTINVPVTVQLHGNEDPVVFGTILGQTAGSEIQNAIRDAKRSNQ